MIGRIVKVEIINSDTGKRETLHEKDNKNRCRFMKMFHYNHYEIQLRLDNNFKPTEIPILDADIKDLNTNEFTPKNSFQHHTRKRYDPLHDMHIYDFRFQGLIMKLYTIITTQISLSSNATFVDKPKVTLIRKESMFSAKDS